MDIVLPEDPAIPLLGIYPEDVPTVKKDTCSTMFIAALFVIARSWKEPRCPSTEEWIQKMWRGQISKLLQKQNKQTNKIHGETHGSSCICSRGWPSQSSMGEEALGPGKVLCPSVGDCQGQEVRVGGLMSRGSVEGMGVFRGDTRKGDNI